MKLNEITQGEFADALKDPEKFQFTSKLPALKEIAAELGTEISNISFVRSAAAGHVIGMKFKTSGVRVDPLHKEKLLKLDTAIRKAYEDKFEVDIYMIGDIYRAYEIWEGKDGDE